MDDIYDNPDFIEYVNMIYDELQKGEKCIAEGREKDGVEVLNSLRERVLKKLVEKNRYKST